MANVPSKYFVDKEGKRVQINNDFIEIPAFPADASYQPSIYTEDDDIKEFLTSLPNHVATPVLFRCDYITHFGDLHMHLLFHGSITKYEKDGYWNFLVCGLIANNASGNDLLTLGSVRCENGIPVFPNNNLLDLYSFDFQSL